MMFNIEGFLPPIFGGKKTITGDLSWAKKSLKNAPTWGWEKIVKPEHKGKGATQLLTEFGAQTRSEIVKPMGGFTEGLVGKGAYGWMTGKQGWLPDIWGTKPSIPSVIDEVIPSGGEGGGNGDGGGLINFPEWPTIPEWPEFDLSGMGESIKGGMDDFAVALAMGLGSLGQGLGAGIEGGMPDMPSMQVMDEEGQPNILLLGGLAVVAYMVLKGK